MIRTLLVDDEDLPRRELNHLLCGDPEVSIIGEATNGIEAVEAILRLKPDLLFLDIEMPGLNGFEVINSLNHLPRVVFVTAYDQYAIRAFEVNALDYLLKPVTIPRLRRTLERVKQIQQSETNLHTEALQRCIATLQRNQMDYISRLAVQKSKRIVLIRLCDVMYIKVEDKLVFVHTASERFLINKTISELEQGLAHKGFFRINRSTIVNLDYLDEIIPWFSATYLLKLSNGLDLPLSRERVAHLKEAVGLIKKIQK